MTKGENFACRAARVRKPEAIEAKSATKRELLTHRAVVSRMVEALRFQIGRSFRYGQVAICTLSLHLYLPGSQFWTN